jgi:hypothetical protein
MDFSIPSNQNSGTIASVVLVRSAPSNAVAWGLQAATAGLKEKKQICHGLFSSAGCINSNMS